MYKWAYSTSKSDNVKQIIIVSICDFQVIYNFNLSKTSLWNVCKMVIAILIISWDICLAF